MIKATDLRKGRTCMHEGELYVCHECRHVAKGNKRSYMQAKLKHFKSGNILDVRFRVDDMIEIPFLESKEYEYLYQDGTGYVVMDTTTFDQITINAELIGEATVFLKENMKVAALMFEGNLVSCELPHVVELAVTDTPPVVKGATATNQTKDATLETGVRVKVPPFIGPGDVLRIDTRSGEYMERAK
jgi:elongation factor P